MTSPQVATPPPMATNRPIHQMATAPPSSCQMATVPPPSRQMATPPPNNRIVTPSSCPQLLLQAIKWQQSDGLLQAVRLSQPHFLCQMATDPAPIHQMATANNRMVPTRWPHQFLLQAVRCPSLQATNNSTCRLRRRQCTCRSLPATVPCWSFLFTRFEWDKINGRPHIYGRQQDFFTSPTAGEVWRCRAEPISSAHHWTWLNDYPELVTGRIFAQRGVSKHSTIRDGSRFSMSQITTG